ncbi:MAG TPA: hypothetical protein VNM90_27705, partial [Haliangium sp.]|nr:hypothetical protein [Haliangium sp.]
MFIVEVQLEPRSARALHLAAVRDCGAHTLSRSCHAGGHGRGRGLLAACDRLDSSQAKLYADPIYTNLNEIARAALEAIM